MTTRSIITLLALVIGPVSLAEADSIRLRPSARIPADAQVVTLAQIAHLDGSGAESLGAVVICEVPDAPAPFEVTVRAVRSALDDEEVHWGRTNLSGNKTVIRPVRTRVTTTTSVGANAATTLDDPPSRGSSRELESSIVTGSDLVGRGDVLGAIGRYFVTQLDVAPQRLRLELPRRRPDWLDLDLTSCEAEISCASSPHAERVPIRVRIWHDGRPDPERLVTMKPTVLVPVATPNRDIERGSTISAADIQVSDVWTGPRAMSAPSEPEEIVGRVATRRLRPGESLRHSDMERACIVKRGQLVKVLCKVGSITIELDATARDDAALGDVVEVVKPRERTPFLAQVVGPGVVAIERTRPGAKRVIASKE